MTIIDTSAKKKVTIPSTVWANGKSYKVTAITANTFNGNRKLTKIKIGRNIQAIGKNAFKNCGNLISVNIKATQLKKAGKNAFKGIHPNARIKLPKNKFKAYKKLLKNKGQGIAVRIEKQI